MEASRKLLRISEIGLLEAGFVLVLLVLLFGLLNFFDVLLLARVFPPLSFLPQQHAQARPVPSSTQNSIATLPSPPAMPVPQQTANDLQRFVAQTLQPEFVVLLDRALVQEQQNSLTYEYQWPQVSPASGTTAISAAGSLLRVSQRTSAQVPNAVTYLLTVHTFRPGNAPQGVTGSAARFATSEVLLPQTPTSSFVCTSVRSVTTVCKRGFSSSMGRGEEGLIATGTSRDFLVFSCLIPRHSSLYANPSATTCLPLRF